MNSAISESIVLGVTGQRMGWWQNGLQMDVHCWWPPPHPACAWTMHSHCTAMMELCWPSMLSRWGSPRRPAIALCSLPSPHLASRPGMRITLLQHTDEMTVRFITLIMASHQTSMHEPLHRAANKNLNKFCGLEQVLLDACWRPAAKGTFPDRPSSPGRSAPAASSSGTSSGKAPANGNAPTKISYVPPQLRGDAGAGRESGLPVQVSGSKWSLSKVVDSPLRLKSAKHQDLHLCRLCTCDR